MARGAWLALCLMVAAAGAHDLRTADGLALRLDQRGAVTGVRVGERDLPLRGAGGCWLAEQNRPPAPPVELLANPSFETGDATPAGWSVGADWALDTTVAHTGRRSMRVSVPGPNKRASGALSIDLPVQPNTPYRVSLWLKTAGCAPSYYLVQLDGAGRPDPDYPQVCISHARKDSDWFPLSADLVTAPFCRTLRVYANLWHQTGTAWVDDVSVQCVADDGLSPQQLVAGPTEPAAHGVRQTWTGDGLTLTGNWTAAADHLRLDGEVRDGTGRDRALTVSLRLPVVAAGWTWYDDLDRRQPVESGVTYGAARVLGERRTISLYPFAALGDQQSALALAVPLDSPRMFRLTYDTVHGYCLNFELALAKDAAKHPSRADFHCLLYRLDPRWGFRSAAQRYYELCPQYFVKRLDRPGGAGFMPEAKDWDQSDVFPAAVSIFDYHKRQSLDLCRMEGTQLFQYTEFMGWWGWALGITAEQAKQKPTPEAARRHVEELAQGNGPNRDVARCILNCAPHGADGRPLLHENYVPEWGGYNYLCNPDPEIEGPDGKLNRVTLTYQREVANVDPFKLDGMYYDCAFVFAVDNFRREHFRWADEPLAYDHATRRPVLPMVYSIFECAKHIADDMHARGKHVIANYSVTDLPTELFCAQFVDELGNEMLWTWTGYPKLSLQRVLAWRKPVSMSWQEAKLPWQAATKERELKQAMLYGTFYQLSRLDPELRERWVPLTARLHRAGWEPITLARVSGGPRLRVERFGRWSDRNLHFAVRNDGDQDGAVSLAIDAAALGLPPQSAGLLHRCRDSWAWVDLPSQGWATQLAVAAGDTVVVRVGTLDDRVRDEAADVPELLRVATAFRTALEQSGVAVTAPDYGALKPAPERAALTALAEQLAEPRLIVPGDHRAAWARRLRENVALAQRRVGAALAVRGPASS